MRKLIFIDDDPTDHFLMRHILNGNNCFDVTYTMDGSLVLDYMEENKSAPDKLPDVIFLDLKMPIYSGWQFLDRMQQMLSDLNKNITVYLMSSSVRPDDKERSSAYPFVREFIKKPVLPDVIQQIVKNQHVD